MKPGAFLRHVRERKGMSLRAMCRLSGKDPKALSEYERDLISPSIDTLRELCHWYGVEPWEAVLGQTRAEFLATLPRPLDGETERYVAELVRRHGADAVRALARAAAETRTPEEFAEVLTIFKVIRARREE